MGWPSRRFTATIGILFGVASCCAIACWFWLRWSPHEEFQSGLLAVEQHNWDGVLRAADRLHGTVDFADQEHLLRGIYCLKTDRPTESLKELSQLKPEGELRELAMLTAGEAYYRKDRLAESQQLFSKVAFENPGCLEAHRWLAAIAYDLGAMDQAIGQLEIVTRIQPNDFRSHRLLGHILFDEEQFSAAAASYTDALAARPPAPAQKEVLLDLARTQIRLRNYAAALEALEPADRTPESLSLQAECQSNLGNANIAWKTITAAREMSPRDPIVLRVMGRMQFDDGHLESAIKTFREELKQDPSDHESRHQLSQALRLSGQSETADQESRESNRIVQLKVRLAAMNLEARKRPTDGDLRNQIAQVCDDLGKPQLAAVWRKAAIACRGFASSTSITNP